MNFLPEETSSTQGELLHALPVSTLGAVQQSCPFRHATIWHRSSCLLRMRARAKNYYCPEFSCEEARRTPAILPSATIAASVLFRSQHFLRTHDKLMLLQRVRGLRAKVIAMGRYCTSLFLGLRAACRIYKGGSCRLGPRRCLSANRSRVHSPLQNPITGAVHCAQAELKPLWDRWSHTRSALMTGKAGRNSQTCAGLQERTRILLSET